MPKLRSALATVVLFLYCEAEAYQYTINGAAADAIIQSENYPKSYNKNVNVTWEWNVTSGQWGVIFQDFDLDSGSESSDSYDWLKIDDRRRNSVVYTSRIHPVLSYVSAGPQLIVQFVSDGFSQLRTRGFKLYILYGATKREVHIKIHEATKRDKKPQKEQPNPLVIIGVATLAAIGLVIVVVVVIFVQMNKRVKTTGNRNIFGVRRNSGISHSRRSSPTDEHPEIEPQFPHHHHHHHHQQQQQQQQRRTDRPVKRSNSQLNWMARAELATTIQKSGCTPRPNAYSDTLVRMHSMPARGESTSTPCKAVAACSTSHCLRSSHAARSCDSSLNEYSDTIDSLDHRYERERDGHVDDMLVCELPSYEESFLSSTASKCSAGKASSSASNCYQNAWPTKPLQESQTNIYINTGASSGNSYSIKEITIDRSKCVIKSTCSSDNVDAVDKSAVNASTSDAMMTIYQNCVESDGNKGQAASRSSVQIIDGYAFIVPASTDQDDPSQSM